MKPRWFEDVAVIAALAVFVVLWSSGFIGTIVSVLHAEPMSFLPLRIDSLAPLYSMIRSSAAISDDEPAQSEPPVTALMAWCY